MITGEIESVGLRVPNPSYWLGPTPLVYPGPTLGLVVSLLSPRLTGVGCRLFQIQVANDGCATDAFWSANPDGHPDYPPF